MELEKDTMNRLLGYLRDHGYPESSFAVEYAIGKRRVDLAIIDPSTKIPIQLFEIKSKKTREIREMGIRQLETYVAGLENDNIPVYLVYPIEEEPKIEVERISLSRTSKKETIQEASQPIDEFLNFAYQKRSRINELLAKKSNEKRKTADWFWIICWILAAVTALVFILYQIGKINLDAVGIALFGATIALVIIPFASKLKILGVEFERLKKESE